MMTSFVLHAKLKVCTVFVLMFITTIISDDGGENDQGTTATVI